MDLESFLVWGIRCDIGLWPGIYMEMARKAGEGGASDWEGMERIWNCLWKLKVSDMMKIL